MSANPKSTHPPFAVLWFNEGTKDQLLPRLNKDLLAKIQEYTLPNLLSQRGEDR